MTDKEKKSSSLKRQLKYLKTEKGKAARARRMAKPSKKLSLFQLSLLRQLKNNCKIRVTMDRGLQAVILDKNNEVKQNRIFINTIELLSSDSGRGKFLKVVSKTKNETIYEISKKGLQVLEKGVEKG
jgi:DNA-binding PadR family transcriptional regulator